MELMENLFLELSKISLDHLDNHERHGYNQRPSNRDEQNSYKKVDQLIG